MLDPAEKDISHIGKYEVRGELGHGGMAVVYRARDPRLERDVAVKVLHPHLARDVESRARFEREARAAARLRHPNIVEVYEFSAEERESYLVTEILEGPTLRRFAEQHPDIPAEVVAAIGIVLCDALACAHRQGVIHRDVKPDNIMLQQGGLKLTDFGIAHVADGSHVTVTGQVVGSPAHMAPEQIEGGSVDARTDLFAAGTVLYYLAVGRLPFEGNNAHALLRKILESDYADPVRVAPRVGHRFAGIVRRALERDPAKRYPSAEAMREDLAAFVGEVGWDVPDRELRRYFADPEGVASALRAKLLTALPERGLAARRAGDIPGAMGYFNRALALDPGNTKVLALVRGLARRRRLVGAVRAGGIVAGVAVVTMGASLLAVRAQKPAPATLSPPVIEREPTEIARGRVAPAQAPPEAPPETPPEADPRPRRTPNGERGGHASRSTPPAAETREVEVFFDPPGVRAFSINGGAWREWSTQNPGVGRFPVGSTPSIMIRPQDHTCEGSVRVEARPIVAGEGPQRLRVGWVCPSRSPSQGAAYVADAGARSL